jgi:hypothetical protein
MLGNMSKTPEGRAVAARLQSEVRFAKTNGYFDSLGTEQPQQQTPQPVQQ